MDSLELAQMLTADIAKWAGKKNAEMQARVSAANAAYHQMQHDLAAAQSDYADKQRRCITDRIDHDTLLAAKRKIDDLAVLSDCYKHGLRQAMHRRDNPASGTAIAKSGELLHLVTVNNRTDALAKLTEVESCFTKIPLELRNIIANLRSSLMGATPAGELN